MGAPAYDVQVKRVWPTDPLLLAVYGLHYAREIRDELDPQARARWLGGFTDEELLGIAAAIDVALPTDERMADLLPGLNRTEAEVRQYLQAVRTSIEQILSGRW